MAPIKFLYAYNSPQDTLRELFFWGSGLTVILSLPKNLARTRGRPSNSVTLNETLQGLWNDVLKNNVFVLCKTKMAQSITRRTLAGYTGAKVNAIYLPHLIDRMKSDMDRLKNKLTNPATWGLTLNEGERMKFDIVVGNPPYQEIRKEATEGNNNNTVDIYPYFQELALKLGTRTCLIYPAKEYQRAPSDRYKVIISSAYPNEGFNNSNNIEVLDKEEAFGRTKMAIYDSDTLDKALNCKKYLSTNFAKGIVLMTPYKFLYYLPDFDTIYNDIDWSVTIPEIDQQLYKKYNFSNEEVAFIEKMINL